MGNGKSVRLVDVTLRDAHQCLWATGMTTAMMADIALRLDRAGFEAIDLVGGAVFDVCVRYLREDPWERMRIVSGWVKNTPLIVMTRGQSLFMFEFFPDDFVELAPAKARPGDIEEPGIARVRRERGPFASDDDPLLAAFYSDGQYRALKAAGPVPTDYPFGPTPLVALIKEIKLRPSISSFHFVKLSKAA